MPMRQIEDIALQIATWLRLAFDQFLSSESPGLMAIKDLGEFKFAAIERFRGILHTTVKSLLKTGPGMPEWAIDQVREGWNISSP